MTEVWSLPGYDVQALLGYGSSGEVWRAVELASGDPVALKRLKAGAPPDAVAALRREAHVLQTLDTPYVVRLRTLLGEGLETVLVLDLAAGGSLAALLARRGVLDPSEVVTIAGPLAQALAAAHAQGLAHGDVTPNNILFTADGMPLLADLGLARLVGNGGAVHGTAEYVDPSVAAGGLPDEAADVWSLAAVCHHLLAGSPPHEGLDAAQVLDAARDGGRAPLGLLAPSAPRPLVAAIEQALAADPAARPAAAAFAAAIRRSHAAAPVRLGGPAPMAPQTRATHAVHAGARPVPTQPQGRRVSPRAVALAAATALLAAAAGLGWAWGHRGADEAPSVPAVAAGPAKARPAAAQQTPARPAAAVAPDWRVVLDGLDRSRAAALAAADESGLLAVYAAGSPPLAVDGVAVRQLRAQGRRAVGVRHTVLELRQLAFAGGTARLEVTDALKAYEVQDASGRVLDRRPARAPATYLLALVRTPDGWRLASIAPG